MNAKGLASQAAGLTPEAREVLGLLIAWTLAPVLQLDRTPLGIERSQHVRALFESALEHLGDINGSSSVEAAIASSEELQVDEEPSDPSVWRLDFIATLLYAVRSYTQDSTQDLGWCLHRLEASLDFLSEAAHVETLDDGVDEATLVAISDLRTRADVDRTAINELQAHFQFSRNAVEQLVASLLT